ncbi:MAG: hypothetical protein B7C55_12310 [Actinomycetales bacterium mxb001]|nr:MAG: hypothetical protein B7C55_12310 [Actinomycetales bacterium mxb001]
MISCFITNLNMKRLHCNLKKILRTRRIKQIELSLNTSICENTISKLCNDRLTGGISSSVIEKLCDFLEIDLGDLFELR